MVSQQDIITVKYLDCIALYECESSIVNVYESSGVTVCESH